jgi:hypothetical protein
MSANRAAHTATALSDGRVLVAGGFSEGGSAKDAEVYEPEAGRFSTLPPMLTTRHSHTATLLPDGRVLIAGGYGERTTTLATAELFDPATNTFVPTGSLMAARADHIAVLLKNGKVLVAGGLGPDWKVRTINLDVTSPDSTTEIEVQEVSVNPRSYGTALGMDTSPGFSSTTTHFNGTYRVYHSPRVGQKTFAIFGSDVTWSLDRYVQVKVRTKTAAGSYYTWHLAIQVPEV